MVILTNIDSAIAANGTRAAQGMQEGNAASAELAARKERRVKDVDDLLAVIKPLFKAFATDLPVAG